MQGTPLPPYPWKVLLGAGFAERSWQNLDVKELKGQNLENRGLKGAPMRLAAVRHDRAIWMVRARSDVTWGGGKLLVLFIRQESRAGRSES
jgi:hypothetical protein